MRKTLLKTAAVAAMVVMSLSSCDKEKSLSNTSWKCSIGSDFYYVTFFAGYATFGFTEYGCLDCGWEGNFEYNYSKPNITIYLPEDVLSGTVNGNTMVLKNKEKEVFVFNKKADYR